MGRASVNRVIQVGPEVTPGTAVAASKQLPSTNIRISRTFDIKWFRAQGYNIPTDSQITKDLGSGTMSDTPLNFREIVYPVSTIVTPVITTPGGAILARKWLFTPLASGTDAFKTLTIQEGDATAGLQMVYSLFTELGVEMNNDGATMSGVILGRAPAAASLTGSPTAISQLAASPRGVDVYMDAIGGTIGTTKISDAMTANFGISNKQVAKFVLNTTYTSFMETVPTPPTLTASVATEHNAQSRALYAEVTATSNPVKLIRYQVTGPIIEGATPFSIKLDFAAQVSAMEGTDIEGAVWGYQYAFQPRYSSTFGNKAFELELITDLTAL